MEPKNNIKNYLYIALLLILELIFFRNVIFSNQLIGNSIDARYTTLVAEHWYDFLCGREGFLETAYLYPYSNSLIAGSDLLLLISLPFSLFRVMGIEMYTAYKAAVIIMHFIGTFGMYCLLKRGMNVNSKWALIGTCIFSFSGQFANKIYHTQLIALSIIPIVLLLVLGVMRNLNIRWKKNLYGYGAVFLIVLCAYTSWYIVLFSMFFVFIFLVVLFAQSLILKKKFLNNISFFVKSIGIDLLFYIITGAVLLIPFLLIYLPGFTNSSGFLWKDIVNWIPEFKDIFNYGSANFLFGDLFYFDAYDSTETLGGISLVIIGLFFYLFYKVIKNTSKVSKNLIANLALSDLVIASFISIFILFIITIKVGNNSLWYVVFRFFPFFSSVRAIGRLWLFLHLPIGILIALSGQYYLKLSNKTLWIILFFVLLFDFQRGGVYSEWNVDSQKAFLELVAPPPEDCELFAINYSDSAYYVVDFFHVDAMEIAHHYGLKTINGFTGVYPELYPYIQMVGDDNYLGGVGYYLKQNDMDYIYIYDEYTNTWIKYTLEE